MFEAPAASGKLSDIWIFMPNCIVDQHFFFDINLDAKTNYFLNAKHYNKFRQLDNFIKGFIEAYLRSL